MACMKAILLAASLVGLAGHGVAQDIALKDAGGIRWACGGVGAEERAALAGLRSQANLELVFVTAKRGGYLADVQFVVYAADRPAPVLQVTAEGPMCLLSAPKGSYRIDATYGGAQRSLKAVANAAPARLVFGFPDEAWDGIKASDEEKQQARSR